MTKLHTENIQNGGYTTWGLIDKNKPTSPTSDSILNPSEYEFYGWKYRETIYPYPTAITPNGFGPIEGPTQIIAYWKKKSGGSTTDEITVYCQLVSESLTEVLNPYGTERKPVEHSGGDVYVEFWAEQGERTLNYNDGVILVDEDGESVQGTIVTNHPTSDVKHSTMKIHINSTNETTQIESDYLNFKVKAKKDDAESGSITIYQKKNVVIAFCKFVGYSMEEEGTYTSVTGVNGSYEVPLYAVYLKIYCWATVNGDIVNDDNVVGHYESNETINRFYFSKIDSYEDKNVRMYIARINASQINNDRVFDFYCSYNQISSNYEKVTQLKFNPDTTGIVVEGKFVEGSNEVEINSTNIANQTIIEIPYTQGDYYLEYWGKRDDNIITQDDTDYNYVVASTSLISSLNQDIANWEQQEIDIDGGHKKKVLHVNENTGNDVRDISNIIIGYGFVNNMVSSVAKKYGIVKQKAQEQPQQNIVNIKRVNESGEEIANTNLSNAGNEDVYIKYWANEDITEDVSLVVNNTNGVLTNNTGETVPYTGANITKFKTNQNTSQNERSVTFTASYNGTDASLIVTQAAAEQQQTGTLKIKLLLTESIVQKEGDTVEARFCLMDGDDVIPITNIYNRYKNKFSLSETNGTSGCTIPGGDFSYDGDYDFAKEITISENSEQTSRLYEFEVEFTGGQLEYDGVTYTVEKSDSVELTQLGTELSAVDVDFMVINYDWSVNDEKRGVEFDSATQTSGADFNVYAYYRKKNDFYISGEEWKDLTERSNYYPVSEYYKKNNTDECIRFNEWLNGQIEDRNHYVGVNAYYRNKTDNSLISLEDWLDESTEKSDYVGVNEYFKNKTGVTDVISLEEWLSKTTSERSNYDANIGWFINEQNQIIDLNDWVALDDTSRLNYSSGSKYYKILDNIEKLNVESYNEKVTEGQIDAEDYDPICKYFRNNITKEEIKRLDWLYKSTSERSNYEGISRFDDLFIGHYGVSNDYMLFKENGNSYVESVLIDYKGIKEANNDKSFNIELYGNWYAWKCRNGYASDYEEDYACDYQYPYVEDYAGKVNVSVQVYKVKTEEEIKLDDFEFVNGNYQPKSAKESNLESIYSTNEDVYVNAVGELNLGKFNYYDNINTVVYNKGNGTVKFVNYDYESISGNTERITKEQYDEKTASEKENYQDTYGRQIIGTHFNFNNTMLNPNKTTEYYINPNFVNYRQLGSGETITITYPIEIHPTLNVCSFSITDFKGIIIYRENEVEPDFSINSGELQQGVRLNGNTINVSVNKDVTLINIPIQTNYHNEDWSKETYEISVALRRPNLYAEFNTGNEVQIFGSGYTVSDSNILQLKYDTTTIEDNYVKNYNLTYGNVTYWLKKTNNNAIPSNFLQGCIKLKKIIIGDVVTEIGNYAFQSCTNLTNEVIIPDSVTSIGQSAFEGCTGMNSVDISSGVTSIGEKAFYGCSSLSTITCRPTTPPVVSDWNAFSGLNSEFKIYVPAGSVETYKTRNGWQQWAGHIEAMS